VFKAEGLFQKRRPSKAELYQSAKLFELLPTRPNALWQADVTYIHIPMHGWWYAVTVIDYYSRYLLACHLTPSYSAPDVSVAVKLAREEAERLHGPIEQMPFLVTDNGSCFLAKHFQAEIKGLFQHVRTQYRTPQQLGLLERFHQTLKREEVYWQLYDNPQDAREKLAAFRERYNIVRPHWALEPVGGGDVLTPHDVYVDGQVITIPKWQTWAKQARRKLEAAKATDAELTGAAADGGLEVGATHEEAIEDLYDLVDDPEETCNLVGTAHEHDLADAMRWRLADALIGLRAVSG